MICTIQDNLYLCWQAELLAWNCRRLGRECVILIGCAGPPSDYARRLVETAGGLLVDDTRPYRGYAPSIQPHLLSKYVRQGGPVMLVDSDVLFKSFDRLPVHSGRQAVGSDCGSYLNAAYLDGCDPDLLHHLCTIAHIPPGYVRQRPQAPGAQYILPHLFDRPFWQRIEDNSNRMYALLSGYRCSIHPVQVWTASMWAIWFELLRMEMIGEIEVTTSPALDFCFATDPIRIWKSREILHMAGVTRNMKGYFHKGDYTERPPWECDLSHIRGDNCSWIYAQAVTEYKSTVDNTPIIGY